MSKSSEDVTIFVGSIIHCIEPFSAHTLEKGFVIVRGSQVNVKIRLKNQKFSVFFPYR